MKVEVQKHVLLIFMTGCKNKEILSSHLQSKRVGEKLEGELKGRKKAKICQIRFYAEKILLLPRLLTHKERIMKQHSFITL